MRGPDGAISGFIAHKRDVTGRHCAAEANSLAAVIVEASDDAIVSASLDRVILSWNRGAERLYGYRAEEAVGQPLAMLVPEDRCSAFDEIYRLLAQGHTVDQVEGTGLRRDGTLVAISLTACPLRNGEGRITSGAAIVRDISARKSAESTQSLLAAIVESSDDAIISTNLGGEILSWNKAAQRTYGYESREVVGKNVSLLFPPDRLHELHSHLGRIAGGVTSTSMRWLSVPPETTRAPLSLRVAARTLALAIVWRWSSRNSSVLASLSATALAAMTCISGPPCVPGKTLLSTALPRSSRQKIRPPRGPRRVL